MLQFYFLVKNPIYLRTTIALQNEILEKSYLFQHNTLLYRDIQVI